jgi:hypothetical protein
MQVATPDNLVLVSRWLLAGLALALLIGLIIASPARFNADTEDRAGRALPPRHHIPPHQPRACEPWALRPGSRHWFAAMTFTDP